jgi:hypothetical protein
MQGLRFIYVLVLAVASSLSSNAHASHRNSPQSQCRCYPSDRCWPSVHQFAAFNHSLGGRLIATVPLASLCHDDQFTPYNATECEILQGGWLEPQTQYNSSIAPSPLQHCLYLPAMTIRRLSWHRILPTGAATPSCLELIDAWSELTTPIL